MGTFKLSRLEFHSCNISVIKADAFSEKALIKLSILYLLKMTQLIQIESYAFRKLQRLERFAMNCIMLAPHVSDFEWGFESIWDTENYITLNLSGFLNAITLQDLFNTKSISCFTSISISQNLALKSLSAQNFTMIPKLFQIHVIGCGIEIIEAGTFDQVLDSLYSVYLTENPLLKITPAVFYKPLISNLDTKFSISKRYVIVIDPPYDCNFFWLKYLVKINLGISHSNSVINCGLTKSLNPTAKVLEKCNFQAISLEKVCLNLTDLKFIAYAKFHVSLRMKYDSYQFQIKTKFTETFRIFSILFKNISLYGICNNSTSLVKYVNCSLMMNITSDMWITMVINQSEINFLGIHFLTRNQIWPLHLITVGPRELLQSMSEFTWFLLLVIGIIICVAGVFSGIGLYLCIKNYVFEDQHEINTNNEDVKVESTVVHEEPQHKM